MFEFIEGTLEHIYPNYIVINAQGIGYLIWCANPFYWEEKLQQTIRCYVEQVVRENTMDLYGFKDHEEKQLFLTLNRVSGIGPKSAMSILAANDNEGLIQAIENKDSKYLTKFPGVGKKTASQMILDLSGKLDFVTTTEESTLKVASSNKVLEDTIEALEGLGYSKREINRVEKQLATQHFETTQQALSFAFKLLLN
ncbi:Holliday junction branch migration protein RuvA [Dolosicoccus paucivorans]|uniref:Holliday junction branch migration complex subunit RuvA n=1 Tax=Dolosicoccus paucivorans TaxID=84521 RepID=A0A1G8M5L0_9LACT|nr:Holliday junction branch migration protein RuvA [Dolosicoccus paucivorans]PMB85103.1 Holliday junction branch migration protein RuvA [Dolosicoccus paucivorans]PMC58905.1 Holliday junction branch migration protein RuvA [Dolosicoccus paucivorans]SDI63239.1 Holliday junction DNA helicase subunit RuvA [Dolosicoccus paucivorans]